MDANILPQPSRDQMLWESVLDTGFKQYPERYENYLKYKKNKREKILDYLPVMLDIENVCRCNYRCHMCQVSGWQNSSRGDDLSFDDFKNIIDSQIGLIEVKIQGMGEPLLGKDFFKMIAYARKKHLWVRSTTNASLLHFDENYKKLLDNDICEIQISIDGATKSTYEMIRKGGHFEHVKKNCSMLNEYGEKIDRKRSRMWVLAQEMNAQELEEFPGLAKELGFQKLTYSLNLSGWGQEKWESINREKTIKKIDILRANNLIEIGKKFGIEVTFWGIGKYDNLSPENVCPLPFQRMYISSDMKVVPCSGVGDPRIFNFGSAHDLIKIWNNTDIQSFRESHTKGKLKQFCKSCYN